MGNNGWGPTMSQMREIKHQRFMCGKTSEEWAEIARGLKAELDDRSVSRSHDEYHDIKDRYWFAVGRSKGKSEAEINPMNYWFGRQSN